MESMFILIPLSLVGVGVAIWFFLRMNSTGQFDDTEGPAWGVLMDDDRPVIGQKQDPAIPTQQKSSASREAFDRDQSG